MNEEYADRFLAEVGQSNASSTISVVLPGDNVTTLITKSVDGSATKLGNGLYRRRDQILASVPGKLSHKSPSSHWVDVCRKKYIPKVGDQVVAVVEERAGDFYMMNIASGSNCILNRLAFDGATKRNKPELKKGDVVYARVVAAGRDYDTELSCTSSSGAKKDWSTGETTYGALPEGLVIQVPLPTARRLLRPDCAVLNALGR